MAYGLQIWNASGVLTFDSTQAAGGVCLGFFTVPAGGVLTFPDMPTAEGIVLNPGGIGSVASGGYTTDNALGYLRFNFSSGLVGYTLALFAL